MAEFISMHDRDAFITDMRKPAFADMRKRPFTPMPGCTAPHSIFTPAKVATQTAQMTSACSQLQPEQPTSTQADREIQQ